MAYFPGTNNNLCILTSTGKYNKVRKKYKGFQTIKTSKYVFSVVYLQKIAALFF